MNFLDSLIWKFGANDHEFLVEKGLFNIIYGRENETIKNAWGKEDSLIDVVSKEENKFFQQFEIEKIKERTLINEVIEIFEILSAICFDRVINDDENKIENDENKININNNNENDEIKLERNLSSINNNSTSDLIQNILSVIFSEISRAYENYNKFRGISYNLYNQYIKYLEDDILAKKKRKEKKRRNHSNAKSK